MKARIPKISLSKFTTVKSGKRLPIISSFLRQCPLKILLLNKILHLLRNKLVVEESEHVCLIFREFLLPT